ncbi:MAG: BatD family protein [bacterium]|nr:BatD family protein [bacterium]
MRSIITHSLLVMLMAGMATAADVSVSGTVDKQVMSINDTLNLQITINGTDNASAPEFTPMSGFRIVQGPSKSSSVSVMQGAVSRLVIFGGQANDRRHQRQSGRHDIQDQAD